MRIILLFSCYIVAMCLPGQSTIGTQHICGTPPPVAESFNQFEEKRKAYYKAVEEGMAPIDETFVIPIHLIIISKDDGTLPDFQSEPYPDKETMVRIFRSSLAAINREFHEKIKFQLCKVDVLACSDEMNTQPPSDIARDLFAKYPEAKDDNIFRIFVNNERYGRGDFPVGLKLPGWTLYEPYFIMHELGHAFGLAHTNYDSYKFVDGVNTLALAPDHTPIPGVFSEQEILRCVGMDPAECFGDRIADTPVDYMETECAEIFYESGCLGVCTHEVLGTSYTYERDYTNVMGSIPVFNTRSTFSKLQRDRMYETVILGGWQNHDFSFLTDEDEPDCNVGDSPSTHVSSYGRIDIFGGDVETTYPFPIGRVGLTIGNPNSFISINDRLGKGFFQTQGSFIQEKYPTRFDDNDEALLNFSPMLIKGNSFEDCRDENTGNPLIYSEYYDHFMASYELSILDIYLARLHIFGIQDLDSPYQLLAADVNYNGNIDPDDVNEMIDVLLRKKDHYDNVFNWLMIPKNIHNSDPLFNLNFYENPFAVSVNFLGEQLSYLPNENGKTYFGSKIAPRIVEANGRSLPIPLGNPKVSDGSNYEYYALKYGNLNFSYGGYITSVVNTSKALEDKIPLSNSTISSVNSSVAKISLSKDIYGLSGILLHAKFDADVDIQKLLPSMNLKNTQTRTDEEILEYSIDGNTITLLWLSGPENYDYKQGQPIFDLRFPEGSESVFKGDVIIHGEFVYFDEKFRPENKYKNEIVAVIESNNDELVKETEKMVEVTFHPNPFSNNLVVLFKDSNMHNQACNVTILEASGKKHSFNGQIMNSKLNVPSDIIESLSRGLLFIQVSVQQDIVFSGKVIKAK